MNYTVGSLYFTPTNHSWPAISGPFNTPGTYVYWAQVNGTASGSLCSIIVATVATVTITVSSAPPIILTQPFSQAVYVGQNASFNVVASGCPSAYYQWYFNATNIIANATGATYTVSNAQSANAGNYTVVVTNMSGRTTSSIAVLTVLIPCKNTVAAWGNNGFGQTNVPCGLSNVVAVAGGWRHSLALKTDGTVVGWGEWGDSTGQPLSLSGVSNAVAVAGGVYNSLILKNDGTVMVLGSDNSSGQTNVPTGLSNVVAIAAGNLDFLALKSNGTVVGWGDNGCGESAPPAGLSNVVAISAGGAHSLALKSDGTIVGWGATCWASFGEATPPPGLSNVIAIAAGWGHSLALKSNGTVVAWGYNGNGECNVPAGLSNVVAISAGAGYHSVALKKDGTVVAWGDNSYGESSVPAGLTNVTAIAAGGYHSLAIVDTNDLAMVDSDYDGVSDLQELKDGTNPNDPNSVLKIRLAHWRFDNTNSWVGDQGQIPLNANQVRGVPSWNTNAVLIDNTNGAVLSYRDVETNGNININLQNGTISFWFRPTWSSTNISGVDQPGWVTTNAGGMGPGDEGPLIEVGRQGSTNGWWGLMVGCAGTNLYFCTQTNSSLSLTTNLSVPIGSQSNSWHHLVLTYSPISSSLYIDGQAAITNGLGVTVYPGPTVRAQGFTIGGDYSTNQSRGTFEDLETFNYVLTSSDVSNKYQLAILQDNGNPSNPIQVGNDSATAYQLTPKVINVLQNDSDPDAKLFVSTVSQGTHGSVVINPDNTVTYTSHLNAWAMNLIVPPVGQQFTASSININNLACGTLTVNGKTHAALWQVGATGSGAITDLDPNGTYSVAETINDNGTVVGYKQMGDGSYHAFVYSNGQMTDLHSLVAAAGFQNSEALGINNQGQICGYTFHSDIYLHEAFFLDSDSNVVHFDPFGGHFDVAYSINNSGEVVGAAGTPNVFNAFMWQPWDGVPADLASYFSIPNQWATAVNDRGDIGGYTAAGSIYRAYVIQNGILKDLSEGYLASWVDALNSQGQLVGSWLGSQTSYTDRALFWQGSQYWDLNTLLPAGSGWVLTDPVSINQNGLIIGNGTYQGQPSAFALMAPTPYQGPDTFSYTASDGTWLSTATVTVNVVNPIQAVNDQATVFDQTAQEIDVLGNDGDSAGRTLNVSSVTQGAHGSVVVNPDNTVTYTPKPSSPALNLIVPPAGQQFTASSININGLACGALVVGGNTHAALWRVGATGSSAITDLDPNGTYSIAESINDSGEVVGYMDVGGGVYHAFKYAGGQMTDLHSQVAGSGFPYSYAWAVNNQGQICGQTLNTGTGLNEAFFVDTDNSVTHFDTFGGHFVSAYGINDSGEVVGCASTPDVFNAFEWQPGDAAPTDLSYYFSIPNQWAYGVNARGDIGGVTALYSSYWAYVIQNGVFRDLSEGYPASWVNALNSKGQIVGGWSGSQTSYTDRALYWESNQYFDLNSLLPPNSGWILNDPVWINENGWIVGNGTYQGQSHAFAAMAPTTYVGPDSFTYTACDGVSTAIVTVSVNVVDPNLDTDGDGLPDWWEMKYFGQLGVNPNADSDNDGVSNYLEYLEGTNPRSTGTIPDTTRDFIKLQVY